MSFPSRNDAPVPPDPELDPQEFPEINAASVPIEFMHVNN
jgi:hypothetical protein